MNLSPREKLLLKIGGFFILPLLAYQLISQMVLVRFEETESRLINLTEEMNEFDQLGQKYRTLQRVNVKRTPVNINRLLTKLTNEKKISNKPTVTEIQDAKSYRSAQIKFSKLRMDELAYLIYGIENTTPVVIIEKIDIERSFESKDFVNVSMILITE